MANAPTQVSFLDRHRELLREFVAAAGVHSSPAHRTMAERASALAVWCEAAEGAMALGRAVDMTVYLKVTQTLGQILAPNKSDYYMQDITPVVTAERSDREKARAIAFAIADARHRGQLHLLDPQLIDFAISLPPEDIDEAVVMPIASNDNPQEFSCQD